MNFKIAITVEICTLITVLDPHYHRAARWGNAQSRNTNEPALYGSALTGTVGHLGGYLQETGTNSDRSEFVSVSIHFFACVYMGSA